MPGVLVDDLDGQPVLGIGAAVEVLYEKFLTLEVLHDTLVERVEDIGRNGQVHRTPIDLVVRDRISDDELIFGRAAGTLSGAGDERASSGQLGLAAAQRRLHQLWRMEISMNVFVP